MREAYRRLRYRLSRGFVGLFARPIVMGELPEPDREVVYVLHNRSLFDLVLLERIATRTGIHSPLSANQLGEERSFFFLNRPSTWRRKHTMMTLSERMQRMEATSRPTRRSAAIWWRYRSSGDAALTKTVPGSIRSSPTAGRCHPGSVV